MIINSQEYQEFKSWWQGKSQTTHSVSDSHQEREDKEVDPSSIQSQSQDQHKQSINNQDNLSQSQLKNETNAPNQNYLP